MNGIRRFFGIADLKGTSITLYTFSQILNISVFEKADICTISYESIRDNKRVHRAGWTCKIIDLIYLDIKWKY